MRRVAAAAASAVLILSATACSDASGDPEPLPPATDSPSGTDPTPSEATEPTQEPTDTVPTEGPHAGYTAEEIQAYEDALTAYDELLRASGEFRAKGKATPAAKRYYDRAYTEGASQAGWTTLQQLDENNWYGRGRARVVWAKPKRVLVSGTQGGSVTMSVCTDISTVRFFERNGDPIDLDQGPKMKRLTVVLDASSTGPWTTTSDEVVGRC